MLFSTIIQLIVNTALTNCFNTKKMSEFVVLEAAMPMVKLIEDCKKLITLSKEAYVARLLPKKLLSACATRWNTNLDKVDFIGDIYADVECPA
ncbi:hypothetical protein BV898_19519 [Hypsibius exemplaris]|uniref:Uncharacterized protein n=1 Tax=Hypsibius exemplaris TaxID=2072580 RepID=A0A9X6RPI8_HYPEX|nr:hypothetical protein BV898_19519 [Hypsibius exemplaris]